MKRPKLKHQLFPWDVGYDNLINKHLEAMNKYIDEIEKDKENLLSSNVDLQNTTSNLELKIDSMIEIVEYEEIVDIAAHYPIKDKLNVENMEKVLINACKFFKVRRCLLVSKLRKRYLVNVRIALGAILGNIIYNYTLEKCGETLNRDHSSIVHYNKMFINLYQTEPQFKLKCLNFVELFWGKEGIVSMKRFAEDKSLDED